MALELMINTEAAPADGAAVALLERAVTAAAAARGVVQGQFSLTLLDDGAIADLNARYLGHAGATDVIAFALFEPGEEPVGDVYLGYAQAQRQAAAHGVTLAQELVRLAVHGTLHVLGAEHPEGEERLESPMWRLQEQIVTSVFERG